jgi:hypothetical protein
MYAILCRFLSSTFTEKNAKKNMLDGWKDGQTDRGKTVYPPPPSGSGGIITKLTKRHDTFDLTNVTTVAPSPGEYINPTPAPTADVFGNPILHPTPEPQGSPTPSPQTDEFGNPVRHTTFKIPTKDTTTRISG